LFTGESCPSLPFLRCHPLRPAVCAHSYVDGYTWGAPGTQRYFMIQRALPQGLFPAARLSVFLQGISLATLVGIVFGVLVAVH